MIKPFFTQMSKPENINNKIFFHMGDEHMKTLIRLCRVKDLFSPSCIKETNMFCHDNEKSQKKPIFSEKKNNR